MKRTLLCIAVTAVALTAGIAKAQQSTTSNPLSFSPSDVPNPFQFDASAAGGNTEFIDSQASSRNSVTEPPAYAPAVTSESARPAQPSATNSPAPPPPVLTTPTPHYSALSNTPHIRQIPVSWDQQGCCTQSPIAQVLMREFCVDGLWDGYACERAAECMRMHEKLAAARSRPRLCQKNSCDQNTCDQCAPTRNRYKSRASRATTYCAATDMKVTQKTSPTTPAQYVDSIKEPALITEVETNPAGIQFSPGGSIASGNARLIR